jgi:transposase
LFDRRRSRLCEAGLLQAQGQHRTDSTHVLAAIQTLNRLECIGETLRHALNVLAVVTPAWWRGQVPVAWFDRSGPRFAEYRFPPERTER